MATSKKANASTKQTSKPSTTTSSVNSKKQPTSAEMREWYIKNKAALENYAKAKEAAMTLKDVTKTSSRTIGTFSKDTLRTYMKNPTAQYKNLRKLSRFLYYRSSAYRRLIWYSATMIDPSAHSIIPIIDPRNDNDPEEIQNSFYDTANEVEKMNLALEMLKLYIICFREDVAFGCVYWDDEGFFVLPLDADYCEINGMYPSGDFSFAMDMTYFSRRQELLEFWGEPFNSMWKAYQKDTTNGKWQSMPAENCICFKVNIDDWEYPLPPYMAMFNSLINLCDMEDIQAIAEEQQIYKLIVGKLETLSNATDADAWSVDPGLAAEYFNMLLENLPEYTTGAMSPLPVDVISFTDDATTDVNRIENATKAVFNASGGAQILNSSSISGTTAWNNAMIADTKMAISSLLPQTQQAINRLMSYHVTNPARIKFLDVSAYTKKDFKSQLEKDGTYGLPVKLAMNALNGYSAIETLSLNFLEEDVLHLSEKFVPLQSSHTQSGSDTGGAPTKDDNELTDEGAESRENAE